jgi:hypothetical protein
VEVYSTNCHSRDLRPQKQQVHSRLVLVWKTFWLASHTLSGSQLSIGLLLSRLVLVAWRGRKVVDTVPKSQHWHRIGPLAWEHTHMSLQLS